MCRALRRLLGLKGPPPSEEERRWQVALERYRQAEAQMREAATPEELDLAYPALLTAQAEVQWALRLAKRDRGLPLRPVGATRALYRAMVERWQEAADGSESRRREAPEPGGMGRLKAHWAGQRRKRRRKGRK